MKKVLKVIAIAVLVLVGIFLLKSIIPILHESNSLKRAGYTKEEIDLIDGIRTQEDLIDAYLGKPKVKHREWSHLTEVYDSDGTTLIGYYIEFVSEGYVPRRYYLDLNKKRVSAANYGSFDKGEEELREAFHNKE